MNISVKQDVTCIPVKVLFKDGTEMLVEDGIITECNHAAYKTDTITVNDGLDNEYERPVFTCRCDKISYDGAEWF